MVLAEAYMQKLFEHELAIAGLYENFARQFHSSGRFWHRLSAEEISHSKQLEQLVDRMNRNELEFSRPEFNIREIEESLEFIDLHLRSFLSGHGNAKEALSVAVTIEEGIIERNFFAVIDGDPQEVQRQFKALSHASQIHFQRLKTRVEHPFFSRIFPFASWYESR